MGRVCGVVLRSGRWLYSRRIAAVEPVFANFGHHKRTIHFTLHGSAKVATQWQFCCLVASARPAASKGGLLPSLVRPQHSLKNAVFQAPKYLCQATQPRTFEALSKVHCLQQGEHRCRVVSIGTVDNPSHAVVIGKSRPDDRVVILKTDFSKQEFGVAGERRNRCD